MNLSLKGQVVLVTGASRGIGAAIARMLGQAGATVAVHYSRSEDAAAAVAADIGGRSQIFSADLRFTPACEKLIGEVMAAYGRLDVLVNNAGVALPVADDATCETWEQVWMDTLQINLVAAAALCKWSMPHFIAQGNGRIIHIASRAAFRGDTTDYMAYAASKGGMVALSRSIARGYGKQGVKSFVIAPGFTKTDMAIDFVEKYGEEYVVRGLALDRLTLPEDIAPTALFLASGYMDHATGCTIDINAGSYVR
jgi:NAD(P)-dependent dehydrogenase (short-subunit alcohol dehydrogenase family)